MIEKIFKKIFISRNERVIRKIWPTVKKVNEIYKTYHNLKSEDLIKKTEEFTNRIKEGEPDIDILPEAFALVKEACRRLVGKRWKITGIDYEWDMIPFDVQIIGAVVLHQGKIAEMATGEGKTLVATMPLYLNSIIGRARGLKGDKRFLVNGSPRGINHLVTVNDYLAKRDREWMGPVYEMLGLEVGVIQSGMEPQERKPEYNRDITYGTNNEFGFDYLRDNMVFRKDDKVQRGHIYAIVDEIDSILIDEARTPLIISGPVDRTSNYLYKQMKPYVERIVKKQTLLINNILHEAEISLKNNNIEEAAKKILLAKKGAPKSRKLFKLLQEPDILKITEKIELELLKEKKLREFESELFYVIDEKSNNVDLTEKGRREFLGIDRELFLLPDLSVELSKIDRDNTLSSREKFYEKEKIIREYSEKSEKIHAIKQLLKAYSLFEKDDEYVVMDGKVIIVDEFTGRLMPGRRWSDGLHEAIEAKEGVEIQRETQTLATITIQNYFRMYEKLAGMTGTAITEAQEFWEIYKLDVISIPTNKPVIRVDLPDIIFKTKKEKYQAVIDEIKKNFKIGRPVLVGTTSVEVSELLSRMLKREGIPHHVLNAKYHQQEAEIVSRAGQKYAVTIATNMAGRGTDIKLGEGVRELGGLYIIGTEKHEARRIDRQLRGRSGRQGDPGTTKFFLSLEDDLLRLFGSDKVKELMERFGKKDEGPIESKLVTKALETAQKRVEMQNFEIRKRLLEYDDVMNKQREVIYGLRNEILEGEDMKELILNEYVTDLIEELTEKYLKDEHKEEWNTNEFLSELYYHFLSDFSEIENLEEKEKIKEFILKRIKELYEAREQIFGKERMRELERAALLFTLDTAWREHLYSLDNLREGIYLRAYGQRDPLLEYKQEAYKMFDELLRRIRNETIHRIFHSRIVEAERRLDVSKLRELRPELVRSLSVLKENNDKDIKTVSQNLTYKREIPKVGRNDPCPCGSGKKYKKCHGKNT
ncbi:MAG: preprotein translocase subunit SecA [Candidatus Hydrothermales bacterium]